MAIEGTNRALCKKCGKCCWDWILNRPETKCEFLGEDFSTCALHANLEELDYNCYIFPNEPAIAKALHPDCGYRKAWFEAGVIDKDGNLLPK